MSSQALESLLQTRLKTQVDAIGSSTRPAVQWPGMTLASGLLPYLRPAFLPTQPTQATLGPNGYKRERGIYQVDCYYPTGDGRATGQAMAEAIAANFKMGTIVTGSGYTLKITSAVVRAMREEKDRIGFPVVIEWYADTALAA